MSSKYAQLCTHCRRSSTCLTGDRCLATPCHTQDSICYYATDKASPDQPGNVFTGDTLFIAGPGRFFEGTGEEMHKALSYLGTLPDNTVVCNGHEYTASNLKFALSVDPENAGLARLRKIVEDHGVTTALTTIGDEKEWNPFMRLTSDPVKYVVSLFAGRRSADGLLCRSATKATSGTAEGEIMDKLRSLKNNFKG